MALSRITVTRLINETKLEPEERLLIMVRVDRPDVVVWGKFDHPYDRSQTADVRSLFASSFSALFNHPEDKLLTADVLPILSLVGRSRFPVVMGHPDGRVEIYNGEVDNTDSVVGFG